MEVRYKESIKEEIAGLFFSAKRLSKYFYTKKHVAYITVQKEVSLKKKKAECSF